MLQRLFFKVITVSLLICCSPIVDKQKTEKGQDSIAENITTLLVDSSELHLVKPKKLIEEKPPRSNYFKNKKCDIEIVTFINRNSDSVNISLIRKFLFTFGKECINNAEYSQYSNEVLFKIMDYQTAELLEGLTEKDIELEYILKVIEQPIHDGIDVNDLHKKVSELEFENDIKYSVLKSLQLAIDRKSN